MLFLGLLYGLVSASSGFYHAAYFVERGIPAGNVGVLFIASSIVTIFFLLGFHALLIRIGMRRLMWVSGIAMILGILLLTVHTLPALFLGFVAFHGMSIVVYTLLDMLLEADTGIHEELTGRVRGLYLTVVNLAYIIGPFIGGALITAVSYEFMYLTIAAFSIIFLLFAEIKLRHFKDPIYAPVSPEYILYKIIGNATVMKILGVNLMLRLFYAITVLYLTIFFINHVGLSIATIGIIASLSVIPFVLFQYPLGMIGDTWLGEKEMLIAGFVILSLGCVSILLVPHTAVWMLVVLLIMNTGAAMVEVLSESYFFKHVRASDDAHVIAFRLLLPVAYLTASIISMVTLLFAPIEALFVFLTGLMIVGIIISATLVDTTATTNRPL